MEDVIYEVVPTTEVVFEGDMALDGHLTERQQRQAIFSIMRQNGIPVINEKEFTIGYDGAEDDNGISETQTSHYVVSRTYPKKSPFLVTREEVYTGEWILDGLRMTPEEQRQKIFAEARENGVAIENEDEYEIGFEGAEDDNGISETQKSRYVIFHVSKKRITEEEAKVFELRGPHQKEAMAKIHDELVLLREKIRNSQNPEEISFASTRMEEVSDLLDKLVDESTRDYSQFERALADVQKEIDTVKEAILANMKSYVESYERIREILKEQTDMVDDAANVEDIDTKIREMMKERFAENEESHSIQEIMDKQLDDLKKLVKKREKIKKDYEMAKALGISALEYREISDNFRSRKLINAILEKKGLGDILAVPAKERTAEQKRRIRTVRKEILEELAKMKKENEDKSVLKLVEALYGIETEVKLKGKQRILMVKPQSLENIVKNAAKMPEKIGGVEESPKVYEPGEIPDDMKPVMEKREEDAKAERDAAMDRFNSLPRVVIYQDDRYPGKYFAIEDVFAKFNLMEEGDPVQIGEDTCYALALDDVDYIVANAYNEDAPYVVEFKNPSRTLSRNEVYPDARGLQEQETIFIDQDGKYYVRKPAFARFAVEPVGADVRLNGTVGNEIRLEDVRNIVENQNNEMTPYDVVFRKIDLEKTKEVEPVVVPEDGKAEEFAPRGLQEQETIFIDEDGKYYVRKPAFERFDVEPIGADVRLNGTVGNEIAMEDVRDIVEHQNNETSPYNVVFRKVDLSKVKDVPDAPPVVEENAARGLQEQETVFIDEDGKYYMRKPAFERFDVEPIGEDVRLAGTLGNEIAMEDVREIVGNQNNPTSPYNVVFRKVDFGKKKEAPAVSDTPPIVEENPTRGLQEQETVFIDQDGKYYVRKPAFDRFDVQPIGEEVKLNGTAGHEIAMEDVKDIVANQNNETSPYNVVFRKVDLKKVKEDPPIVKAEDVDSSTKQEEVEYIPGTKFPKPRERGIYETDEEYVEYLKNYYNSIFHPFKEETKEGKETKEVVPTKEKKKPVEHFTIYRDQKNPDSMYARKYVFERFNIEPVGEGVRVAGALCYPIATKDVQDIVANQNNDMSPYEVIYLDIELADRKSEEEVITPKEKMASSSRGLTDQITIFIDEDGKYYVRKPVFDRFDIQPKGEEVRLAGTAGYEVDIDDVRDIVGHQDNELSPYKVVYNKVDFGKKKPVPKPVPEPKEEDKEETITLFRDINDNNQVYAPDDVLQNFGIKTLADSTMIQGVPCHKISRDTDQIINSIAKMSKNPKLVVRYVDVEVKEKTEVKPRPHVEAIIAKVTDGLDIHAKDGQRYQARNICVSKGFVDELHSGNYAYNIVHIVPATLKAGVGFFRKLGSNIFTTPRSKEAMAELEKRLSELSEEELEVLFEEYRGSQLKTDMNNQINPLVLERLKKFGLERVTTLNDRIQKDYVALFTLLGQIKVLEEKLKGEDKETGSLENQRQALMKEASEHVQSIISNRKKANDLLSGGIHGLEEDFKAVSTKLSYVGMRFAKTNDFDNDLQHKLGQLGRKLNTALAAGDDEAIVQNFMGLESCYYENTAIRGSLAGKRSVGSKYYTPVAEQFDYRDDPFIRDLFTTIAVTSAAVSAVNAIRVHQIEANKINDAEQQATLEQVHQLGKDISDKRGTFEEGMKAQAEQDILTNADVRERAHLDLTNWKFNDAYHAADHAGHAAYNQFNIDVNTQINAVTADYAQGLITQAQALERMAQISNQAQATLRDVVDSSLEILKPYAASHPQFDLTAVQQSMEYIVAHPTAIADMNRAMVEVTAIGDKLQAMEMSALGTLPSDMASTLVCAASAVLLATNVSSTMSKVGQKKGTYGNEITAMMDEYLKGEESSSEDAKVASL